MPAPISFCGPQPPLPIPPVCAIEQACPQLLHADTECTKPGIDARASISNGTYGPHPQLPVQPLSGAERESCRPDINGSLIDALPSSQQFISIWKRLNEQYLHDVSAWDATVQFLEMQLMKARAQLEDQHGALYETPSVCVQMSRKEGRVTWEKQSTENESQKTSLRCSPVRSRTFNNLIKECDETSVQANSRMRSARKIFKHCCRKSIFATRCWKRFSEWYMTSTGDELVFKLVEPIMGVMILLNCITIGISLDTEDWEWWPFFNWLFVGIYIMEIFVKAKLIGWRELYWGRSWAWSVFDTSVIILAILDLLIRFSGALIMMSRILKVFRLTRLLRLMKLPALKELIMLIRGMMGGARCLFWCMIFLFLPIYIVGILLSQLLKDWDESGLFSSVPAAMFTTFRCMCNDCSDERGRPIFYLIAKARGWYFALSYSIFTLVMTLGVFNLITAIFLEGTMLAAKSDTILQRQIRKAVDRKFAYNLKRLVFEFWNRESLNKSRVTLSRSASLEKCRKSYQSTCSVEFDRFQVSDALEMEIDQEFYQQLIRVPIVREILNDMDLYDDEIVDLFDMLDVDRSGTLDVTELVNGLYKLRGDATKKDLVGLSYLIYGVQDNIRALNTSVSRLIPVYGSEAQGSESEQNNGHFSPVGSGIGTPPRQCSF